MSDPLSQYLASRQPLPEDPERLRRLALGLSMGRSEGMDNFIPWSARPFFESLGADKPRLFNDLPETLRAELAQAQPLLQKLGPDYDYRRLSQMAVAYRGKMPEPLYRLMGMVGALGEARAFVSEGRAATQGALLMANRAGRQVTFGIVPSIPEDMLKDADLGPRGQAISTIFGDVLGIGLAGNLVVGAIGLITKAPKVAALTMQIPQRIREITFGFSVGATLDALRPDGLPEDPAALDVPARIAEPISEFLGGGEAADRVGLAVGGGLVGAAFGELIGPIIRGINLMRQNKVISRVGQDKELVALMRQALSEAGVPLAATDNGADIIRKTMENLDRVSQSQRLAGVVSARLAREDYIMNQIMSDPRFVGSEDARYMAALFRTNPGGITIAKDVSNAKAAAEFAQKMGLQVHTIPVGSDVIMFRPRVQFPEVNVPVRLQQQLDNFAEYIKDINRGKPSTRVSITPMGETIRGDYQYPDIASRFKLKPPVVAGAQQPDIAVREHLRLVTVQVGDGGSVTLQLPSVVTQEQVRAIGQFVDLGIPNLTITGAGGKTIAMNNPIGIQVEDALAGIVQGASRPKLTAEMITRINQYRREGIFQGQAARDPSGYPLEIIRRVKGKKGSFIQVRDPMTGYRSLVNEDRITILPTNLEGEFQPSNLFMRFLEPKEQGLFASLRKSIQDGYAEPIRSFHDLEEFASANGKFATSMGKGKVSIFDPVSQERMVYDNHKAAVEALKEMSGPMPDLTPPELERLLGFKPNFGGLALGPPARFGESIPLGDVNFEKWANSDTFGQLVPGFLEQALVPTRDLLLNLEERYGLPFGKIFLTIQEQVVKRQNFMSAWVDGVGPGLPDGVMPFRRIMRLAGPRANQQLINAYLEAEDDAVALARIAKQMTDREIKAAKEMRKFYDAAFATFGIEQNYIRAYAPHFRTYAEQYGNRIDDIWRHTKGTPLPKGVEAFADYARDGVLKVYEDRAFVSGLNYLEIMSHSRFLKEPMKNAALLLKAIPDNAVKAPLMNYLEALRGSEFAAQKAAIDATIERALRNIGVSEATAKGLSEKLTLGSIGLIYNSTMAFRLGPVIRNLTQLTQTTWPMFGGLGDDLAEGIGRAMTTAGRDAAIMDGAVALKSGARFAAEEIEQVMPSWLNKMSELGLRLYDGADNFNRVATYWTARIRATKAVDKYANAIKNGKNLAEAQRALVVDAGAHIYHRTVVDEFLRRLANGGPEPASRWLGKQAADVTQFLYGRGNQPRWMRSVPGRFLGQFGTWPLWYVRSTYGVAANMIKNGYKWEAVKFLARVAIANMALYEAGKAAGIDLRRWMAGNSLFYTGGPAVEIVRGVADLVRGTGESFLATYESPATRARIASGAQTLQRVGRVFIPAGGIVNDLAKAWDARTPTARMAALLGVYPSTDFTVQQRLDLLIDTGMGSTDIQLEADGDTSPTAVQLVNRGMEIGNREDNGTLRMLMSQQPSLAPPPAPQGASRETERITNVRPVGRPPMPPTALPDSIRSGESKPIPQ